VVAGKHAKQMRLVTFGQEFHDQRLLERWATQILTFLVPARRLRYVENQAAFNSVQLSEQN
ncbi:MAG: hypothetical protein LUQ11_01920, partial [Methylococcaceae bacterium]|nr:hypothetical protein [Methylococcaceae bacterium]